MEADAREKPPEGSSATESSATESCSPGEHRRGRATWTRSSSPTTWSVSSHDRIYYCCCDSGNPRIGNENPSSSCASERASSGTRLGFSSSSTSSSSMSSSLDSDISLVGCNRIMIPAILTQTSSESPTGSPCHRPSPCASSRSWRSRSWWASPWSSSRTSVTRKALTLLLVLLLGLTRADTCEDSELSRDCNDIEISAFHHLAFHQNCTTVEGRLHISDLDLPINITSWDDFGFPYLREITGHLRLKNLAGLQTLRQLFPNLAVIRGDALDEDKWALVVHGLPDLEELGLDTLTYIRNGAVKLKNNSHLCYYESIDWGRLAPTVNITEHYIMESNLTDKAPGHVCRESCSLSCPVTTYEGRRRGRCWSQGADACQKHLGCTCPDGGFCADDGSCCHAECSGGCSGPLATDCVACKQLVYGDTCVTACPDETYLFSEQHRCVSKSECQSIQPVRGKLPKIVENPPGGIKACTYHCPKGYMEDRSQGDDILRCIKCHGLCHIPCDGMKIQANVTKLQMLENCTVIEGSLEITLINYVSQETYKQYRFPNLREITGYLMLFRVFGLRTLRHMFPNLAVIKGQVQFFNNSLVIQEMRDLEEVGLVSLTSIVNGSVFMSNNYRLCFVSTVDWGAIAQGVDPSTHHFMKNRGSEMCHDACSDKCQFSTYEGSNRKRCWTSMEDGCQRNLKPCNCQREGKLCGPNKECCHSYCLGGCTGPKQSDCLACRDVRWKSKCVPTCPRGTFMLAKCRCLTDKECLKLKQQDFDPKLLKGFGSKQPSQCLYECPTGYREDILPGLKKATRCLKCVNGFCPKVCNENPKVFNIRDTVKFRGCSKLVGNLDLHLTGGDDIDTELRQNFGAIQEITGYLRVMGANPLLSLHFFENLQVIGGERLANKQYSLLIMGNYNLERLFNHSTTKKLVIHQGEVALHNNRKLCPSHIVELMTALQENRLRHNMTDEIIFDFNNNTNGDLMPCQEIVMNLEIMNIEATNINIRWSSYKTGEIIYKNKTYPTGDNRHALQYIFFYQKSQENNTDIYKGRDACTQLNWKEWRVSMNNNNSVLPHLDPFTRYALFIKADILPTAQGSARSPVVYFTTKPDKPTEPTDPKVISISPSKLEISWKPPKSPNGIIHDYKVFYTLQKFNAAKFEQRDYCQDPINKQAEEEAKMEKKRREEKMKFFREQSQNCCECPIDGDRDKDGRRLEEDIAFHNHLIGVSYLKLPTCGNFTRRENVAVNYDKSLNETTTTTAAPRGLNGSETTDIIESLLKFMNGSANETIDYLLANATTDENSTSASNLANDTLEAKNSTEPELESALVTREVIVRGNRITLGDLEHFSYYDIEVVACHDYDHKTGRKLCGDNNTSARATGQTKSYAPYDDINTANISAVPSTTKIGDVFIYWQPPAKPNGIILKYTIKYKKVTTESTANYEMRCISRQQYKQIKGYKLENLEPGNYSYQINAHSLSDNGSFTQELFFTVAAVAGPDSDKVDMLLLVIVLVVAVFTCIIIVVCWRLRAKYIKFTDTVSSNPHYMHTDDIYSADEWEVDREDIRLIKELGQGSFGMVFEGIMENKEQGTSTRVAIKTVNEQADFIERWKILKEATTMKVFECHHVVKLLGVVSKSQPALVILELMALGDLRNYLRRCREEEEDYPDYHPPSSNKIRQMAGEIADGMAYLADKKIVHRDLAARNCLVAEDTTVKIADFGMARDVYMTEYYRKDQRALLPIRWMAPESLHDGVFTTMSDIWSYGVVLWEMVTLAEQPYQGLGNEQVLKYVTEGYIMGETEGCPEDLFQIMKMCWAFHPRKRPTFKWIIEMLVPYISSRFHKVSYFFQEVAHSDPEDTGDDLNLNSEDNSSDEYIGVNRREGNEGEEEREEEDDDEYDEEDRVGFEEEKLIKGDHNYYPGASGNDDATAVGYPVTSLSPTASCQVRLMPMSGAKKYYNAPIDHHVGAKPFKGKQNSPPSERGSVQQQPLLHPASPASSYASSKDRHRHLANSPNRRSMGDGGDDDGDSLDAAADIDADDGGHFDRGLMDSLHIDEDDSSPEHLELAVLLPKRQQPADNLSPPGSRPEQHPSSSNLNCSSRPSAVANPKSNEDSLYTMMTRPVSKNKPPPSSSPLSSSTPLSPKPTALFSPSSPTVPSTSSLSSSLSSPSSPPPATTVTSKSPSSSHPAHSAAKTTSHSPSPSSNVNPPQNTSPRDPTSNPSYSSAQQAKSKPTLQVTTEDHHLRNATPGRGSNSGRESQPGGGGMGDNAGGSGWHDAFQNNKGNNARSRNKFGGGGGNCAVLPNDYSLYSDSSDVDSVNSSSRNANSEGSGSKESSSSSGSRHHMPQANGHGPYSHQQAALC